ncbi:unnamed protein product [Camellia sinensis]
MEEVVSNLVRHVYSAPTQMVNVFDMQERTIDGKNYYTFEYALTSPNFSRAAFATIAIGNGTVNASDDDITFLVLIYNSQIIICF